MMCDPNSQTVAVLFRMAYDARNRKQPLATSERMPISLNSGDRGFVTEMVPADSSAEAFQSSFKALPTVPGGVSVTREVRMICGLSRHVTTVG